MDKKDVSIILQEIAELLELKGENPFKSRAYYAAARAVETISGDIKDLVKSGELGSIKGIGKGLSEKISLLVETGRLPYFEELKASFPPGIFDLMKIPGLGPKKVKVLYDELGIDSLSALEKACLDDRLIDLPGFGKKTQSNILWGIDLVRRHSGKYLYAKVLPEAQELVAALQELPEVQRCSLAGSLRRKKEIVKDMDILASSEQPSKVMDYFVSLPLVQHVVAHGETKSSVTLTSGINVDIRVVSDEQYPYALHHFTGSKEHNVAMRGRSHSLGIKMNEYGLFKGEELLECHDEKEIYAALKLDFIPPELREDMGEIDAAENHTLPVLVEEADVQGLLHVHTVYSDASATIREMVEAMERLGFSYIGISDHSRSAVYAGGIDLKDIRKQHAEIDGLNKEGKKVYILKSVESDILPDGSLDYPDEVLESFDFIIASVHSHFNMTEAEMTARIIKAMENKYVTILGHPTGRLLLEREPYAVNITKVIDAAAALNVVLEVNSHPQRLDLDWRQMKYAQAKGVRFAVNPDAHSVIGLNNYIYGIGIARKGWLTAMDIINCYSLEKIKEVFQQDKSHKNNP